MRLFILTKTGDYVKIEITGCRITLYFKFGDFQCQIVDARFIFLRYFVYLLLEVSAYLLCRFTFRVFRLLCAYASS